MRRSFAHWPKIGLALAALFLIVSFQPGYLFWVWIQIPIYFLHQFEEHGWPGGFQHFANQKLFHSRNENAPFNSTNIFWINFSLIWVLFPLVALYAQYINPDAGVFLPIFSLLNAATHILALILKRQYNPGLITATFLMIPFGIAALILSPWVHWANMFIAFAAALFIHLAIVLYAIRKT